MGSRLVELPHPGTGVEEESKATGEHEELKAAEKQDETKATDGQEETTATGDQEENNAVGERAKPTIPFRAPVRLNVGGTPFTTSYGTLVTREPDSHLAKLFLSITEVDNSGYFFDRDGTHFRCILNWLRDGHVNLPPDATVLADIRTEAAFYGLPSLVNAVVNAEKKLLPHATPGHQAMSGAVVPSPDAMPGSGGGSTAVTNDAFSQQQQKAESLLQQQKAVQESMLKGLERILDKIQALQISQAEQTPACTQGFDRKLVHSKTAPQGPAGVGAAPAATVAPAEALASLVPSRVLPDLDGARLVNRMEQNGLCKVGDVVVRVVYRVLEEFAKSCDKGHCKWESRCQLPLERQVDHDDVAQMVVLELWRRGLSASYEVEYECLFVPAAGAVVNRVPRQLLFRGYPLLTLAQQPDRAKEWAGWPANLMLLTLASGSVNEGRKMQVELS